MTTIDELAPPSNSLKASDLEGEEFTLTIKSYEVREFDQEKDGRHFTTKKPVFSFESNGEAVSQKKLVCNKTNLQAIAYAYGKEMDDWIGKPITLFPTMVPFGDKLVEAIRVRVVRRKARPTTVQSENPADGMDDEIPF